MDWCNGKLGFCQHDEHCSECGHFNGEGLVELSESLCAYIQQLEAQVPRWISVKERLPEDVKDGDGDCVNYLVYIPEYRSVDIANYIEEVDMWVCMGVPVNVTHWMPLPESPKEEK